MTGRLASKVALITGGASGIGLASVELFAAEGAQIVVADIQDEKGLHLEQRFGNRVRYFHCDVRVEADIAAALTFAQSQFGGLDVLFNNAGISDLMFSLADIDAERWSTIFDILVRGPILGLKHGAPLLRARGGGSVINTASIAGLQAGWGPIAYSCAKAALIHMSRIAAAELSPHRIRVNAICPGTIATSIFGASFGLARELADQMAEKVAEKAATLQPIPKAGMPEDIARAAIYLASDDSTFVTGTHIVVDGGVTIGSRHSWDPASPSPFGDLVREMMPPVIAS